MTTDFPLENLITKSIRNFINTFKSYLSIHLNKEAKHIKTLNNLLKDNNIMIILIIKMYIKMKIDLKINF